MRSKLQNQNKKPSRRRPVWIVVFIVLVGLVLLYCIVCSIISNLDNVPKTVKIIFGLSDLANTAIGALLGFGASLLLENYIVDGNKEKAIDNIATEMTQMCLYISKIYSQKKKTVNGSEVSNEIEKLLSKFDNKFHRKIEDVQYDKAKDSGGLEILKKRVNHYRYTIYLPIWDSILQNGDLLRFKDKGYFECLINIYTRLNKFKAQIDSFDSDLKGEELFIFLFELYCDVQKLRSFIKDNKEHVKSICQYLKGANNLKLKKEFLSEFNFD